MNPEFELLTRTIRQRRTRKVLAKNGPIRFLNGDIPSTNELVLDAIATAGSAPFHYDRKFKGIAEPWRFHVIWHEPCRILAQRIPEWFADIRPGNKLPAMLNACGALVLVTWLPQFDGGQSDEKKLQINEEHLAATAAAIQNLLLLLTSAGLGSYWSSGGFFRSSTMFAKLGMDLSERLLGAVFVDYGAMDADVEIVDGKQRENRSDSSKWTRIVNLIRE